MIDTRAWDARYDNWADDPENAMNPGPHPDKNHAWNIAPEVYHLPKREENDD